MSVHIAGEDRRIIMHVVATLMLFLWDLCDSLIFIPNNKVTVLYIYTLRYIYTIFKNLNNFKNTKVAERIADTI